MSEADERLLEAAAELLQLPIEDAFRPGVLTNLEVARRMAALVEAFPLDDEAEPAPVYLP